jgi:hypothetical protein
MSDAELDPSIQFLARDWREAAERYRGPRCIAGCQCPMSQALDAVARFVAIVEAFDRGEIVMGGLPIYAITAEDIELELWREALVKLLAARLKAPRRLASRA